VVRDAVVRALAEIFDRPRRRRDADHGAGEITLLHHGVQRGEALLPGSVARHAEEHERVGHVLLRCHQTGSVPERPAGFSSWPPNSMRMALRILSAKSALARDENRANSAAASTSTGTPSSTAACTVHRPSPESDTRPSKSARSELRASASAVRSSSHDATTLPRRHTSATAGMSRSYW